jgi:hypothetical protein
MSRCARPRPTWLPVLVLGLVLGGSLSAQSTPPRLYIWSETLSLPEGEKILAPSAVAASQNELLVADGLAKPRLLLFGKQGVSWQLQQVAELPAVAQALTFDGERWIGSLRGGVGLMAFGRTDLSARPVPQPSGLVAGAVDATPGGTLLVFDLAAGRVVELSPGGDTLREAPVSGHVTGLAADWTGGFLIALPDEARVLRFDRDWQESGSWALPAEDGKPAWPVALSSDEGGTTVVLDRHGGRLMELDANGRWVALGSRRGWEPGLLFLPSSLDRLPNGAIVVADEGNGRVQIFRRIPAGDGT